MPATTYSFFSCCPFPRAVLCSWLESGGKVLQNGTLKSTAWQAWCTQQCLSFPALFSCSLFLSYVPLSTGTGEEGACHPRPAALPRRPGRSSIPTTWSWTTSFSSFLLSQDVFSPFCDLGCAREEALESWNTLQHRSAKLFWAAAWTGWDKPRSPDHIMKSSFLTCICARYRNQMFSQASQDSWGWKAPVDAIPSSSPAQAVSARAGCPGPHPLAFQVFPWMETPQPVSATYSSIRLPPQ